MLNPIHGANDRGAKNTVTKLLVELGHASSDYQDKVLRKFPSQHGQTLRMESFKRSPHGFWYPTVVRDTMPATTNNNPPPIPVNKQHRQKANQQGQTTVRWDLNVKGFKKTVRYHFDFDGELPDSLFTIDDGQVPNK